MVVLALLLDAVGFECFLGVCCSVLFVVWLLFVVC